MLTTIETLIQAGDSSLLNGRLELLPDETFYVGSVMYLPHAVSFPVVDGVAYMDATRAAKLKYPPTDTAANPANVPVTLTMYDNQDVVVNTLRVVIPTSATPVRLADLVPVAGPGEPSVAVVTGVNGMRGPVSISGPGVRVDPYNKVVYIPGKDNTTVKVFVGATEPSPVQYTMWIDDLDPDNKVLKVWSGTAWHIAAGAGSGGSGLPGTDGATILVGATPPDDLEGRSGDLYLHTVTGDLYQKNNGLWGTPVANVTGPQGPEGPQGPIGLTGPEGPQGIQGPAGPQGEQGPAGADGATGPQGVQGEQGPIGPAGPEGPQGPQGVQGEQGPIGPAGPEGPQGPSGAGVTPRGAYAPGTQYYTSDSATFEGSQWLALRDSINVAPVEGADWTLYVQRGEQGIQGEVGPEGPIGLTGPEGPQGPIGLTGPEGPQGIQGEQGPIGPEGPQGPAGVDGADAVYADTSPVALGTASPGAAAAASRADHVHPMPGASDVGAVPVTVLSVQVDTFAGAMTTDFDGPSFRTVALTGDVTSWATTNRGSGGKSVSVRLTAGATDRALAFNASWAWLTDVPTLLATGKVGILEVTTFGPDETDVIAAYKELA